MKPTPSNQLFILLSVSLGLMIAGAWVPLLLQTGITTLVILFLLGLSDILFSVLKINVSVKPVKNHIEIPVKTEGRIEFNVTSGKRAVRGEFTIDLPPYTKAVQNPVPFRQDSASSKIFEMILIPQRRGDYSITNFWCRVQSLLHFWNLQKNVHIQTTVRVLPQLTFIKDYIHLTRQNRADKLGIHKTRSAGAGMEWEYLREYTRDDDASKIEWKASTRVNKPVIQQRQAETGSQIVFLIDCGRYMTAEYGGKTALDHSINAAIMLAILATRQGDDARVITFSDRIRGDYQLKAGRGNTSRLISHLAPIHPDFVESNYSGAFEYLNQNLNRRSLVIFITDILDDLNDKIFTRELHWLKRRHLPLFIFLRDTNLHQELQRERESMVEILGNIAARELFIQRSKSIRLLQLHGADTLDVPSGDLTANLVDKYLQIKAKNRL